MHTQALCAGTEREHEHLARHQHKLVLLVGHRVDRHAGQPRLDVLRLRRQLCDRLRSMPPRSPCPSLTAHTQRVSRAAVLAALPVTDCAHAAYQSRCSPRRPARH